MEMMGKADILSALGGKLYRFKIPELEILSFSDWSSNPHKILGHLHQKFGNREVIVRSSVSTEDGENFSMAGKHLSVGPVSVRNGPAMRNAVDAVIRSYGLAHPQLVREQFFVQEMVADVTASGVVFTREMNSGAPYYVINYDDISANTSSVTAGMSESSNRSLLVWRSSVNEMRSSRFKRLLRAIAELEDKLGRNDLDIEFALDGSETPHLLQVRPITSHKSWDADIGPRLEKKLVEAEREMRASLRRGAWHPGSQTVLGQMPDWNPAEIIGETPRVLALSLYRRLITDQAWIQARVVMGYWKRVNLPLLVEVGHKPYIDVRLSFNSLIPKGVSRGTRRRLVTEWVQKLIDNPHLHDKIEFEIAASSITFDLDRELVRKATSLNPRQVRELRGALIRHGRSILSSQGSGTLAHATAELTQLESAELPPHKCGVTDVLRVLDLTYRFGTVPFGIVARHGFVAKSLLDSLVRMGIFSKQNRDDFLMSVPTVASDLVKAFRSYQAGRQSATDFFVEYGHLRPGTYDITSRRYDSFDYLSGSWAEAPAQGELAVSEFYLSSSQQQEIDSLFRDFGLNDFDAESLLDYCSRAIAAREKGKFIFTRALSWVLEALAENGRENGLDREIISHIPLGYMLETWKSGSSTEKKIERLRRVAARNREAHQLAQSLKMPVLISSPGSLRVIPFQVATPNFITSKSVVAPTALLDGSALQPQIRGHIVLIESADPGFDWIFAQEIAGLITKYGGANSHMAIRASEFAIPAAIGCGEELFRQLRESILVRLDCELSVVRPAVEGNYR